jgi:hypothetical protein
MTAQPQSQIPIIPLTSTPDPTIIRQIVTLHQRSIVHDNALMRFHPPFDDAKTQKMLEWWTTRLSDAGCPSHHVFIALAPPSDPAAAALLTRGAPGGDGESGSSSSTMEPRVVGMAELLTPASDTGQ